jgi:hypothetical protein
VKQKPRLITKDDILVQLYKSDFIKDLIWTITSGNQLKEDLKSELFLILFEMDDRRILGAYNNNYLHYLCVNILKKQYHSKTSPFHKKFRWSGKVRDTEPLEWKYNYNSPLETAIEEVRFPEELMEKIIWFVDNKLDLVDRELFKIYYKIGRYDRWLGDLRDTNCKKSISSLRKVENKLAITTIEGKKISIGYDTIRLSLNRSIMRIKYYLKENELD